MSSHSPWMDLPTPITELILEGLPPSDYIRFGSVCKEWHSIQKQHRIRHSPFPPPMLKPLPWLVPRLLKEREKLFRCYSPFEQKCYPFSIPKSRRKTDFFASSHGWFFFVDDNHDLRIYTSLFNPVSESLIKLPQLMCALSPEIRGVLSTSPLSPNCVALILDCWKGMVHICWLGQKQPKWTLLEARYELGFCTSPYTMDCVYCSGKFYCSGKVYCTGVNFFVIDSIFTTPTIKDLVMDCSKLLCEEDYGLDQTLVEFNGEVFLVVLIYNQGDRRFEVFKADFSRMMWVKVKSIEDLAFFIAEKGSLCVLAADVGCKGNCVYATKVSKNYFIVERPDWSVYDMGTMRWWSSGPLLPYKEDILHNHFDHWFLPSLDYNV